MTMPENLTEEQVRHVAKLSRLRLEPAEVTAMAQQLSHVLDYISKLNELDVTDIQPMTHPMDVTNVLREDTPEDGLPVEAILANAPEKDPPYFMVPKVLGDGSSA